MTSKKISNCNILIQKLLMHLPNLNKEKDPTYSEQEAHE